MRLTYRGSVNRWECDENDHLNVRFYVAKHVETLLAGLLEAGVTATPEALSSAITQQHLRFLRESRLALPLSGYCGVLRSASAAAGGSERVSVLTELRHSLTDEVLCTCVHTLDLGESVAGLVADVSALPEYAQPRGVAATTPGYLHLELEELLAMGFNPIGAGLVCDSEVRASNVLDLHHYMGRISDAMPHLWAQLNEGVGTEDREEGGAVLEYRLRYHRPLNLGERFTVYSGLAQAGSKVQRFAHLIYNESAGQIAVSAGACGVRMDLTTRRAVSLSAKRRQHMQAFVLKDVH